MYTEKKSINGHEYYYLKASLKRGGRVKTKTIAYLGKAPMTKKQLNKSIQGVSKTSLDAAKEALESSFGSDEPLFLTKEQAEKLDSIKKGFQTKLRKLDNNLLEDMFRDFKTAYTYNTTAIEGNTLTLEDTNLLLNENITPKGKNLKEVYDQINEKDVFNEVHEKLPAITASTIIDIHQKLLKNIDNRTGSFRQHNVRVFGAEFKTSDARYVMTDMKLLLRWYTTNKAKLHPLVLAAVFHEKFERIHPFYDGNGRTGRMLTNIMLLQSGFPPLVVNNSERAVYYHALSQGHKAELFATNDERYRAIVQFFHAQLCKTYEEIFVRWG